MNIIEIVAVIILAQIIFIAGWIYWYETPITRRKRLEDRYL